ncbi:MAG: AAA family ATPase [Candidatus Muproteobacteria bacterium RBG_16_60_9]|uniref:AAA family ATPase n=1 Tax=Candidatus Muproteobacteria bacterium RBG_16_60_9 TaxID=1817755 RepID=A0A1F6UYN6_9PROT|nr:MAG: AAA family ATPase [Candidatus Muproteobacteria bacterium RBG_16_60_9]
MALGSAPSPAIQQSAAGANYHELLTAAARTIGSIVLGKDREIRLALACILARGHLLIEDLPGVGKTTLAHVLAQVLGLEFKRIQFTSDLLPADILGVSIYQPETQKFQFHRGPVFAQLVLADEINRTTPKTQSALLEAMEERQVTSDGVTLKLPEPFFVIATQNPHHLIGTFPLPESQLDRFLLRIELGYPDSRAERALLKGRDRRELLNETPAVMDSAALLDLQEQTERVHVADALLDYIQALIAATRESPALAMGLSPRGGLALLRTARAWALLEGRSMVLPEDVQAVADSVIGHRVRLAPDARADAVATLLKAIAIP